VDNRVNSWRFSSENVANIRAATIFRAVEHFTTLPSTNDRAMVLAQDRCAQVPALVLADQQTAGRGRSANGWWSVPGSLTFSVVLDRPDSGVWQRVSLTAGLAVCETIAELCPQLTVGLKWPNDVFVQDRKVAGVLIEAPPPQVGRYVIGVGVNVNNSLRCAPVPLRSSAISLTDATGQAFDLTHLLIEILGQVGKNLKMLVCGDKRLAERWKSFCILTGRNVSVDAGPQRTAGICRGINSDGALLVQTHRDVEACFAGTVTILA